MEVNRYSENISRDHLAMPRPKKTAPPGSFGARLKDWRVKRGLSQGDLATAMGISQPSLSEQESGESKEPMGRVLIKAADKLRLHPKYLLTGEGPAEIQSFADISGAEAQLVMIYRQLPTDGHRQSLLIYADNELKRTAGQTTTPPARRAHPINLPQKVASKVSRSGTSGKK